MKRLGGLILWAGLAVQAAEPPNILLMMVDDLGFSDFGCYGSEIETPRIDALAESGVRCTQFYNTAKCNTSRVCLLSGLYCNQAGGFKLSRATTIADVLGKVGYFTSMTGKWHINREPTDVGFQRYWGHLSGATDYFIGDDTFRLNGEPWNDFDEDFYNTDANVDWAIKFIDEALESGKPFFHYIAFNAPHFPLQAPKADIHKYMGRYNVGWDVIRSARFAKQKKLGLFPKEMLLAPMPSHVPAWSGIGDRKQEFESFRMAIYAGMVDRLDQNMGRLIDYLKKKGALENTLILLCSDNGACPFERSKNTDIPPWKGGSDYTYDGSWATVGNTPFKHYKQTQHEGGISSPFIIAWPKGLKNGGRWDRAPRHLVDIMATCIEVGQAEYPTTGNVEPLAGKSFLPLIQGLEDPGHNELYFKYASSRGMREGDWKLVSFYGAKWELYNVATDRQEQKDLAEKYPERVMELSARWRQFAADVDKLPVKQNTPVSSEPSPNDRNVWHGARPKSGWELPKF